VTSDENRSGQLPEPNVDLSCREIVELMTGYLEESLPEPHRRSFEEHIGLCPDCETYLAQLRRTIDTLGELREESLTPPQREGLLMAFRGWHRAKGQPGAAAPGGARKSFTWVKSVRRG